MPLNMGRGDGDENVSPVWKRLYVRIYIHVYIYIFFFFCDCTVQNPIETMTSQNIAGFAFRDVILKVNPPPPPNPQLTMICTNGIEIEDGGGGVHIPGGCFISSINRTDYRSYGVPCNSEQTYYNYKITKIKNELAKFCFVLLARRVNDTCMYVCMYVCIVITYLAEYGSTG